MVIESQGILYFPLFFPLYVLMLKACNGAFALKYVLHAFLSRWYRFLGPRWRELLKRNESGMPDPRGQVYAAPYRWVPSRDVYHNMLLSHYYSGRMWLTI